MNLRTIVTGSLAASAFILIAAIIGAALGIAAGSALIWAVDGH